MKIDTMASIGSIYSGNGQKYFEAVLDVILLHTAADIFSAYLPSILRIF
jgi:hypothetical protein